MLGTSMPKTSIYEHTEFFWREYKINGETYTCNGPDTNVWLQASPDEFLMDTLLRLGFGLANGLH